MSYKRKSTECTILIKSKSPGIADIEDFFKRIFYKNVTQYEKARLIYDAIILGEGIEFICQQNRITKSSKYEILRRLKGVGLISKEKGGYRPSNRFRNRLNDMARYPEIYISRMQEKHQLKIEVIEG